MIVVVGRVQTDDAHRDELIRIGQAVAQASRQEAGCIHYGVFEDTERRNEFVFVEEWQDEEALQEHFRTPHITTFMSSILGAVTAPPAVGFHTIERSRDLSDVAAP
jgi:quinol monooxygenase YgiN